MSYEKNDDKKRYYYNGPSLSSWCGFLNYVDPDQKRPDDILVLTMRLDVSHNVPKDGRDYSNLGLGPTLKLKVWKDHEAIGVIDRLRDEGKLVDGRVSQGVKIFVKDAFTKVNFWAKESEKYGIQIYMGGSLSRGGKLSTAPIRGGGGEAGVVNDAPVVKLDDPVDF